MKKVTFDIIVIVFMAVLLTAVYYYDFSETFVKFGIIPLLLFYYIGSFAGKKFH